MPPLPVILPPITLDVGVRIVLSVPLVAPRCFYFNAQSVPCSSGNLTLTEEDCKAFASFPLAPVNIAAYVRNVTRRDKGKSC